MADPFNAIPCVALRRGKTTLTLQDLPAVEDLPPCVHENEEVPQDMDELEEPDTGEEPDPFGLGHQGLDEP